MLLAKIAVGFCGTLVLAGAYTFHEGVMRVDEDHGDGRHVHVWVPAAIVPMAVRVVPKRRLEHAAVQIGPWLPTLRVLTKELEKYPETELVDVRDSRQHVRIGTHHGRLLIDVDAPGESVHAACPLVMIRDVANALEADAPAA
jgi:hypothetical protein